MFELNGAVDDDALKRGVEEIRGCPISEIVPEGDDWTEVSDSARLCEKPVVSIVMLTYNHERYVSQAIESIVTQKTTFPFELVVGEDCSTDKTRSICLDYQRQYPSIVRVIFPRQNTFKKYGTPVFNLAEVYRRCRGEFGAMCEGDDYWIDERKLDKQVEVMRKHPNVSLCWVRTKTYYESTGHFEIIPVEVDAQFGLIAGDSFRQGVIRRSIKNLNTPSILWRREPQIALYRKLRFSRWNIMVGDVPLLMTAGYLGDVYRLSDVGAVYRVHETSVCHTTNGQVAVDNVAISAYFSYLLWQMPLEKFPYLPRAFRYRILQIASVSDKERRARGLANLKNAKVYRRLLWNRLNWLYYPLTRMGRSSARIHELLSEGLVWFLKVRLQAVLRVTIRRGRCVNLMDFSVYDR